MTTIKHLGQICVGPSLSKKEIDEVSTALKKDMRLARRVRIHQILSGETRYALLTLLKNLKELCVCDMTEILGTTVSAVSHQLRVLREAGIVETRREGQTIYYSIKDKAIEELL